MAVEQRVEDLTTLEARVGTNAVVQDYKGDDIYPDFSTLVESTVSVFDRKEIAKLPEHVRNALQGASTRSATLEFLVASAGVRVTQLVTGELFGDARLPSKMAALKRILMATNRDNPTAYALRALGRFQFQERLQRLTGLFDLPESKQEAGITDSDPSGQTNEFIASGHSALDKSQPEAGSAEVGSTDSEKKPTPEEGQVAAKTNGSAGIEIRRRSSGSAQKSLPTLRSNVAGFSNPPAKVYDTPAAASNAARTGREHGASSKPVPPELQPFTLRQSEVALLSDLLMELDPQTLQELGLPVDEKTRGKISAIRNRLLYGRDSFIDEGVRGNFLNIVRAFHAKRDLGLRIHGDNPEASAVLSYCFQSNNAAKLAETLNQTRLALLEKVRRAQAG